jgi:hypothetical protein
MIQQFLVSVSLQQVIEQRAVQQKVAFGLA